MFTHSTLMSSPGAAFSLIFDCLAHFSVSCFKIRIWKIKDNETKELVEEKNLFLCLKSSLNILCYEVVIVSCTVNYIASKITLNLSLLSELLLIREYKKLRADNESRCYLEKFFLCIKNSFDM